MDQPARRFAFALVAILAWLILPPALRAAPGQTTATGLIYTSTAASRETRVTVRRQGDQVVLVDDVTGALVASSPAAGTPRVAVRGLDGAHNDTLTVDLRGGLSLPEGVDFDGGVAGLDTLNVIHDPARVVRCDYEPDDARGHRGKIVVDGTVITYSGLEPIIFSGPIIDLILSLPLGTVGASLQDDGTGGNNTVQMVSTNATFETTTFTVPTNSLTVDAGGGTDTITTAASFSGDFNAALTINGASAADTVTLNALTLGHAGANPGTLVVAANVINLNSAVNTSGGPLAV